MSESITHPHELKTWTFDGHGLSINVNINKENKECRINNGRISLAENTPIGNIHFSPKGISVYRPEIKSYMISEWLLGFGQFLDVYDHRTKLQESLIPQYLYMQTNKHMALFAQSHGFHIVNTKNDNYTVIGKIAELKENYSRKISKLDMKKLTQRGEREYNRYLDKIIFG